MNELIKTNDGTNTLFSQKYKQHFHDIKIGAMNESLHKHIIPAFSFHKNIKSLRILDICFGLGYNTFFTIYYILKHKLKIQLEIYSPELDKSLIDSLNYFNFPKEFDNISHIIYSLLKTNKFKDDNMYIEIFIGNAREYIKSLKNINIVYQDAFSSLVNKELWTYEYFKNLYKVCDDNIILTTYAIATPIRLSMYKAGFEIYEIKTFSKKHTIAFKSKQNINAKYIDMILKQNRNTQAQALFD